MENFDEVFKKFSEANYKPFRYHIGKGNNVIRLFVTCNEQEVDVLKEKFKDGYEGFPVEIRFTGPMRLCNG